MFERKQLADLTIAIGLMNAYNRMAISFRVPPAAAKQAETRHLEPKRLFAALVAADAAAHRDAS